MKTRYRFMHRSDGVYYWESQRMAGDSRVEVVSCSVSWFWLQRRPYPEWLSELVAS